MNIHDVVRGDVLRQDDDRLDAGVHGVEDRLTGHGGRDEDYRDLAGLAARRLARGSVDRQPEMLLAGALRIDAAHDAGAALDHLLGPEGALLSGYALDQDAVAAAVDHRAASIAAFTASSIRS